MRLSGDMLQADLGSKRAAMRSAEASQANAAAALRRGESISATGALSAADLDTLRAEAIAAQARVDTAAADLRTAELRARYATVTAPDSGVITSRTVSVGQIAQAGAEMLRMLRQNRVEWRAEVPEAELKNISIGQEVTISAVDGSKLTGKVRAISPTVQATNRTGIVYVDITDGLARPGMFARGEIEVGKGEAVLLPVASVVMQDGYSYVFVLAGNDTVQRQRIEPAGIHGEYVEIRSGVNVGDVVAVKGAGFLKDGDTIARGRAGRCREHDRPDHCQSGQRSQAMNFVTWTIRNPVPVIMLFITLVIGGLVSFPKLGVQDQPDIAFPFVIVIGRLRAACRRRRWKPRSRARSRTRSRPSSASRTSTRRSTTGNSQTSIEFQFGTDLSQAMDDVRDAVTRIRPDLPQDATEPIISRATTAGNAVLTFARGVGQHVRHRAVVVRRPQRHARASAASTASARSRRIGGVSREVRVDLDPDRMAALGVTAGDVSQPAGAAPRWNCPAAKMRIGVAGAERAHAGHDLQRPGTGRAAHLAAATGATCGSIHIADVRDQAAEVRQEVRARRQAGDRLRGDARLGRRRAEGRRWHARRRGGPAGEIPAHPHHRDQRGRRTRRSARVLPRARC